MTVTLVSYSSSVQNPYLSRRTCEFDCGPVNSAYYVADLSRSLLPALCLRPGRHRCPQSLKLTITPLTSGCLHARGELAEDSAVADCSAAMRTVWNARQITTLGSVRVLLITTPCQSTFKKCGSDEVDRIRGIYRSVRCDKRPNSPHVNRLFFLEGTPTDAPSTRNEHVCVAFVAIATRQRFGKVRGGKKINMLIISLCRTLK